MDRMEEIKTQATKLALESLEALNRGDSETSQANVPKMQALLKEFVTLIPDGEQKENLLKSIAQGDEILANEGIA